MFRAMIVVEQYIEINCSPPHGIGIWVSSDVVRGSYQWTRYTVRLFRGSSVIRFGVALNNAGYGTPINPLESSAGVSTEKHRSRWLSSFIVVVFTWAHGIHDREGCIGYVGRCVENLGFRWRTQVELYGVYSNGCCRAISLLFYFLLTELFIVLFVDAVFVRESSYDKECVCVDVFAGVRPLLMCDSCEGFDGNRKTVVSNYTKYIL